LKRPVNKKTGLGAGLKWSRPPFPQRTRKRVGHQELGGAKNRWASPRDFFGRSNTIVERFLVVSVLEKVLPSVAGPEVRLSFFYGFLAGLTCLFITKQNVDLVNGCP
jgi:hypothetical protein